MTKFARAFFLAGAILGCYAFGTYLDYQASTPCDPRVVDAMWPYIFDNPTNPHGMGIQHKKSMDAVVRARRQIASLIRAKPEEIFFTSGATESNNLAIQGIAKAYARKGHHIIVCVTEHKSVLEAARHLEGFIVTYLPVKPNGVLDVKQLVKAIRSDTILVSIMAANNEIGVIQPFDEIGRICRKREIIFHCDASQAAGKIHLNVKNIDALTVSGHKIYAPKGIGALYIRKGVKIVPLFWGGGQQLGVRSGTLPVPLCVALGEACAICEKSMNREAKKISFLQKRLLKGIIKLVPNATLNGDHIKRIPGNISISLGNIDTGEVVRLMSNFAISVASSCYGQGHTSHVLQALHASSRNTLRVGIGRFTDESDIDLFLQDLARALRQLKKTSFQQNYELLSGY
ncbi:MAG: cysteine desulfurase [Holosporales bacterium]|nr:cysteine desulfurase [Holosporales bacterium]